MRKSYEVLAEGGLPMWDDCKAKSQAIVKVVTDDTEINVAHLLSQGPRGIKVATLTPSRHCLDTQETGRKHKAQILGIDKNRIKELVTLS